MAAPENRPYSLLAKFYDEVLPGMSEMNRHARLKMLNGLMEGIDSACDLACGSGGTALDLARTGKRVFAVDNSSEFCRTVRSRARQNGLRIKVIWTDQEIRQALRTVGFEKPLFQDGMDVRPPIPGAKRGYDAYYLTRKPSTPKLKH